MLILLLAVLLGASAMPSIAAAPAESTSVAPAQPPPPNARSLPPIAPPPIAQLPALPATTLGLARATLELDTTSYLVGAPITGSLVIQNAGAAPLTITGYLDLLGGRVALELLGAGQVVKRSQSPLPHTPKLQNWLVLPAGASVRVPLCWARQMGQFVLDKPGAWQVRATGAVYGNRGAQSVREEFTTPLAPIQVAPAGRGFDTYAAFFSGFDFVVAPMEMMYPARHAGKLAEYGEYERAMAALVVYQESLDLKPLCEGLGHGKAGSGDPKDEVEAALKLAARYGIAVPFRLWVARVCESATGRRILRGADTQAAPNLDAFTLR